MIGLQDGDDDDDDDDDASDLLPFLPPCSRFLKMMSDLKGRILIDKDS